MQPLHAGKEETGRLLRPHPGGTCAFLELQAGDNLQKGQVTSFCAERMDADAGQRPCLRCMSVESSATLHVCAKASHQDQGLLAVAAHKSIACVKNFCARKMWVTHPLKQAPQDVRQLPVADGAVQLVGKYAA